MNGLKIKVDVVKRGVAKITQRGRHHHHHGVVKLVTQLDIDKIIEADALLRTDNLMTRQSFQGRFKKTRAGDRKGRSGYGPEQADANVEDVTRTMAKVAMEEAAAAADVIVETGTKQAEDFVGEDLAG